ncbi:MAG TPA: NADH-quinone oxidoreductase subunit J [Bacteroidetes bacterium]|nr:NADH-quinone oxidoreductase subunit J [Bacteroidota bacterium]
MLQSLFYFLSFTSIFLACMVVFAKNPVHSVLYLILTFFTIAGHYLILNAQFLALVHVVVYAGAIMVLFLFVIMLLNLNAETEPRQSMLMKFAGTIAGGCLMLVLIAVFSKANALPAAHEVNSQIGLIKNLGKILYTDYIMPFEVASILFLIAMIGAVILAKREPKAAI